MASPLTENLQSTVRQSGSSSSQVLSRCSGPSVNSADSVPGHIKEAGIQQAYLLVTDVFYLLVRDVRSVFSSP